MSPRTTPNTKQLVVDGTPKHIGALFPDQTSPVGVRLTVPRTAASSVWVGDSDVTPETGGLYAPGTSTRLPTGSFEGWYAVTSGAEVTITLELAAGGAVAPEWADAGSVGIASGGGGGSGGEVTQGAGSGLASAFWTVRLTNGAAFLAPLVAGENVLADLRVAGSAVGSGNPVYVAFPSAQAVTVASLPLPADAATATNQATANSTLSTISGKLPSALVSNRLDVNVGNVLTDAGGRQVVTHSRGGRTVLLASTTLPEAGAFTSQGAYSVPEGVVGITAYVTYTQGGGGGQVALRPQYGNGTETAREVLVTSTAVAAPVARDQLNARDLLGPLPGGPTPVTFAIVFDVPPGATTFNLLAAEFGSTGTPGTCAITITPRYGS